MILSQTIENPHNPNCRYSRIQDSVRNFNVRFSACVLALKRKVEVGLSFTCGAGRTSLSPALVCHHVVDWDSPAFNLINSLRSFRRRDSISGEKIVAELWKLFETRAASPHDRLPTGETLVHVGVHPSQSFKTITNTNRQLYEGFCTSTLLPD